MKILPVIKTQKGLTLVELMIAILLGSIISILLISLFINSKQSYRTQENLSRLQENGRFAMSFISEDIRMADYWGCLNPTPANLDNNIDNTFFNIFEAGASGAILATNDNADNGDDIEDGTDTITLKGAVTSSAGAVVMATMANSNAAVTIQNTHAFNQGEPVLISDCTVGDLFIIINNPSGGNTLAHGVGSTQNTDVAFQQAYGTAAHVYPLNFARYSIQTSALGEPALFRSINGNNAVELVEGVEDMQILYGEDTDATKDGIANTYRSVNNVTNMDDVVSLRVSLVVRTLDDNVTTDNISYTVPGEAEVTPGDKRMRHVFTSTIAVRNRLL
jgi:type IV pilus assembly protein PilW